MASFRHIALFIVTASFAIENGLPATDYPEVVLVNGCSGVLVAPDLVFTAGHCAGKNYTVIAPRADPPQETWGEVAITSYNGNAQTSLDIRLVLLNGSIILPKYASMSAFAAGPGQHVVDCGRTLNGKKTDSTWVSDTVTIIGNGTALDFPFNLQARPDVSQGGDSGGPIFFQGTHTVVGLVDTDICPSGCEHVGPEDPPVDLFTRADLFANSSAAALSPLAKFVREHAVCSNGTCAFSRSRKR